MALYVTKGKGIVADVIANGSRNIVVLPIDWNCECVRVYQLKRIDRK